MTRRIDAHQHFWHYSAEEYPWIGADMGVLKRDWLPADLVPALDAHGIDATIAVQARHGLEETRFLIELMRSCDRVAGVVGWVDLCSPEVDAQLDECAADLVGVRHLVQDEPDDGFLVRPDFERGLERLTQRDLVFDLLLQPRHLGVARELVGRHPGQRFVLDHVAKPNLRGDGLGAWRAGVRDLARHTNVSCKLSGLVTEAHWHEWTYEELVPVLDHAYEVFGPARVLFGSDWPVCLLAARDYGGVVGILETFSERIEADERAALFGGNAERIYLA